MDKGLWKDKYAANNRMEYWAEGVQSWFDTNRPPDHDHNHVDTREELKEYDPDLAALCAEVFGEDAWRYVRPHERELNVFDHGHGAESRRDLKGAADAEPPNLARLESDNAPLRKTDVAMVRQELSVDHVEAGRLAGTIGSD